MKRTVTAVLVALLIGGIATYWVEHHVMPKSGPLEVGDGITYTIDSLFGYTTTFDYVHLCKTALSGQMKFVGATVDREYIQVENIHKVIFGIPSDATILVNYKVQYSIGYDVQPTSFDISGDKKGITITLNKPALVAKPAVEILSSQVANGGMFINGPAAIANLQHQLFTIAMANSHAIKNDEAVKALCEKKLSEFLRAFLLKQPGASSVPVPVIKIAYKP